MSMTMAQASRSSLLTWLPRLHSLSVLTLLGLFLLGQFHSPSELAVPPVHVPIALHGGPR